MNSYEKGLKLIKLRPHHSEELKKKLLMRGFDEIQVSSAISRLMQEGLIDNDQFAHVYLDNLIKYKTFGFQGLKAKLMQRGIASNDAEGLLKENFPLEKEREIALKILEKSANLPKQKIAQRLASRGFRAEVIRSVLES